MSAKTFKTRNTKGAAGDILQSRAIDTAASLKVNAASNKQKKIRRHLRTAAQMIHAAEYREAGREALKALDIDEKNSLGNHIAAIAMDKLGEVELALQLYQRALDSNPGDPEIYQNLGLLAWRVDLLDLGERFFRLQMQIDPGSVDAANNLGCVLRDAGKYEDATEVLRAAIYAHPENSLLWTSLGVALVDDQRPDEARQFHLEALRLDPGNARVHHNLGYACSRTGAVDEALEHLDEAKRIGGLPPVEAVVSEHARALALLAKGKLGSAWDAYEIRHHPLYEAATSYSVAPQEWKGEPLEGKRLLLMGEQGLGDEVLFLSAARDIQTRLLGPDGKLGIGCNPRLQSLIARSFPDAEVIGHSTISKEGRAWRGVPSINGGDTYDYWARMATPLKELRQNADDFAQPDTGFLTPDPERVAHWRQTLDELGGNRKVGMLWKSGLMNARRNHNFAPFKSWKPTLETEGVTWINLQYGDSDEELAMARDKWGVNIVTLPGIDLKNDLDDLAALSKALDLVIGPMNATTNIAGAVGAPIWLAWSDKAWTMLGQQKMIWYPNTRVFAPAKSHDWDGAMQTMAAALGDFVNGSAAIAA